MRRIYQVLGVFVAFLLGCPNCFGFLFAESPQTVGLISDLSGYNQDYGNNCSRGYQLAINNISDELTKKLKFKFEDSASDVKKGISVFQKLLAEKSLLAAAVFDSSKTLAINPLSERAKIPIVALAAHSAVTKNPYTYASYNDSAEINSALADRVIGSSHYTVAILSTEVDYTLSGRDNFKKRYLQRGGSVVYEETFAPEYSDFNSVVSKILAINPSAVFINTLTATTTSLVIKKLVQQGYQGARYLQHIYPEVLKVAGPEAEGVEDLSIDFYDQEVKRMFDQKYPSGEYNYLTFSCYSGVKFLLESLGRLQESGRAFNSDNLQDIMKSTTQISIGEHQIQVLKQRLVFPLVARRVKDSKVLINMEKDEQ